MGNWHLLTFEDFKLDVNVNSTRTKGLKEPYANFDNKLTT